MFFLFRVYPEWLLKYPMVLCSLWDSELAYYRPRIALTHSERRPQNIYCWMILFLFCVDQCCVTRTRVRTRVHFTWTRIRVQFFSLWLGLGLGLRNRDSWLGPKSRPSPSSSGRAVLRCYSDIRYILLFVFMFWKINKCGMWTTRFVTRTRIFFWLGLADLDSDSDFEVMTRTRTRIWHLDSDTALV